MPGEIKGKDGKSEDKKSKGKTYHSEGSRGDNMVKIQDRESKKYCQKSEVNKEEGVERDGEHKVQMTNIKFQIVIPAKAGIQQSQVFFISGSPLSRG